MKRFEGCFIFVQSLVLDWVLALLFGVVYISPVLGTVINWSNLDSVEMVQIVCT